MSAMLEAAARAVATATGYHFSGESIIENADDNPRSAHFVAVARAVIDVVLPIEREACEQIATSDQDFTDCDARGFMDQETGEVPCSMETRTGICECAAKIEHGATIAARIERRNA